MVDCQLELIPPARPLLERFGPNFFRQTPRGPGVYLMTGEGERILYIGQSGNLRARLGQYKNARRGKAPRKIMQLVHLVRRISWEPCATPHAARLRENELLRLHRPRFNRMNVFPEGYGFILCGRWAEGFRLAWSPEPGKPGETFGAFKAAKRVLPPLARWTWQRLGRAAGCHDYPRGMLSERTPQAFVYSTGRSPEGDLVMEELRHFLEGHSDELLRPPLPCPAKNAFDLEWAKQDLRTLQAFFARVTRRTAEALRHEAAAGRRRDGVMVEKCELDDLLVTHERTWRLTAATGLLQAVVKPAGGTHIG
jgi:predicted GIY-YIG superfamily endonuclease